MEAQWMKPPDHWGMAMRSGNYRYCNTCNGFFVPDLYSQHTDFHRNYTNRSDGNMSTVLWCDPGNHAFKTGAAGSVHFKGSEVDNDGNETNTSIDACHEHRPDRIRTEYIAKELNTAYPITDVGHNND